MMKLLQNFPLWLLCGILYGLSWPIFEELNLSFLAWFAFVPLFIFLEKNRYNFWKSMGGAYAAMVVFGACTAAWLFNFPQSTVEIAAIFFLEEFYFFFPFLPFFFLQKKLGFQKALWLFPFLWTVWEWTYLHLEFTMGTHLSAYSQSSNIWLIQFIDLTGMWGVSFWLMLFNILIYKAFVQYGSNWRAKPFYLKTAKISAAMLALPLLYSAFAFQQYDNMAGDAISVSLIPTQYSAPYMKQPESGRLVVEQTLHRTDSLAFAHRDQQAQSDLYVWPETGAPYSMGFSNLGSLLQEAVNDWDAALLTGCKGVPGDTTETDQRRYVSAALISSQQQAPTYHHKTALTPGQEMLPYHSLLAKIPNFSIPENDTRFYKKGQTSTPLNLTTRNGRSFKVGASLCFEQWYPHHWAALARNGADFYVHIAGEGWYGDIGFQQFMANVSRMRCIENRHGAARCANVGLSMFINPLGQMSQHSKKDTIETSTAMLIASQVVSWYAQFPNWFPLTCVFTFFGALVFFIKKQTKTSPQVFNYKKQPSPLNISI